MQPAGLRPPSVNACVLPMPVPSTCTAVPVALSGQVTTMLHVAAPPQLTTPPLGTVHCAPTLLSCTM